MDATSPGTINPGTTTVRIFVDGTPKFYYVSDIHLELRKSIPGNLINEILGLGSDEIDRAAVKSAVLLLAGDIGCPFEVSYEMFLRQCVTRFAHVIVVAGNHEYYSTAERQHTIRRINRELTAVCTRAGAILLAAGDQYSVAVRVDVYSRNASDNESSYESCDRKGSSESLDDYGELHSSAEYVPIHLFTHVPNVCAQIPSVSTQILTPSVHPRTTVPAAALESIDTASVHPRAPALSPVTLHRCDVTTVSLSTAASAVAAIAVRYESRLVARVVGCTLWTEAKDASSAYMNDYRKIYTDRAGSDRGPTSRLMGDAGARPRSGSSLVQRLVTQLNRELKPYDVRRLHSRQKEFLGGEIALARSEGVPIIVMTHHLPTHQLMCGDMREELRDCYASNSDELMTGVAAWICGHMHKSVVKNINGTYCGINAYGYPTQGAADTGFRAQIITAPALDGSPR